MEEFVKISIKWDMLTSVPAYIPKTSYGGDPQYGPRINWDVPHAIYRSTNTIDINNPPTPYQVLTAYESVFVDDNFQLDTDFYYYVSELRPGGEIFTDKYTKVFVTEATLNIDFTSFRKVNFANPSDAPDECSSGVFMESSWADNPSKKYYCTINSSGTPSFPLNNSGKELSIIRLEDAPQIYDKWKYNGEGTPVKYLLVYVDDVYQFALKRQPSTSANLDIQKVDYDHRNYPAPRKGAGSFFTVNDRLNGITGRIPNAGFPFYGRNQLRPEWWDEYASQVPNDDYNNWHNFWKNRTGDDNANNPRDNSTWYNDTW